MRNKHREARGERHGMAKLTTVQVAEIRRLVTAGALQYEIAAKYGVSKQTISKIVRNQRWKDTQMSTATLGQLISRHGVDVLDHLDRSVEVPILKGLQAQGDLAVIPAPVRDRAGSGVRDGLADPREMVPAAGIAVIEAADGGHEHRLLAGTPGTVLFTPSRAGQDIGCLEVTEAAYLAHPEHGYLGIAPGAYVLRRQREQADEERLVAD